MPDIFTPYVLAGGQIAQPPTTIAAPLTFQASNNQFNPQATALAEWINAANSLIAEIYGYDVVAQGGLDIETVVDASKKASLLLAAINGNGQVGQQYSQLEITRAADTGVDTDSAIMARCMSKGGVLLGRKILDAAGNSDFAQTANNLSDLVNKVTALANLAGAPLASPALTGTPTAPTQTSGDNSTALATDAFVANAVANATPAPGHSYWAPFILAPALNTLTATTHVQEVTIPKGAVITGITWYSSSTGGTGNYQTGIYSSTGTLLASSGALAIASGSTYRQGAFSSQVTLTGGAYFLAVAYTVGPATVQSGVCASRAGLVTGTTLASSITVPGSPSLSTTVPVLVTY